MYGKLVYHNSFYFGLFQTKSNNNIFEKNIKTPQFAVTLDTFLRNLNKGSPKKTVSD